MAPWQSRSPRVLRRALRNGDGSEPDSLSGGLAASECLSSWPVRFKVTRAKMGQSFRSYEAICRAGVGDEAETRFTDEDGYEN
jgi:hypothetical protein